MKKLISIILCLVILCSLLTSCSKNGKYDELVELPAYALDGSFATTVQHLKYYTSVQNYANYSTVDITDYKYSYDDSKKDMLVINFEFECYIYYLYEGVTNFSFEIVAYSLEDVRIATSYIRGEGEAEETVRIKGSIGIDMDNVKKGVRIEFCDHKD